MGVIKRQGIKQSIVNYVGVALGVVSAFAIYPHATEVYGLFRVLYDSAILVSPFILLGFQAVAVRFFPVFEDKEKGHNGFLFFLLMMALIGYGFFLLCLPAIRWLLLENLFAGRSDLFHTHFSAILPLAFLVVYVRLFTQYISNFQRIVVPAIFEQLLIKISLPLLILFYLYEWITVSNVITGVLINYVLALAGLIFYTWWLGELNLRPRLRFIKKPLAKEISVYALYGVLGLLGGQLAFRIDTLMVGGMIDVSSAGIYTIVAVLTEVIIKPARAILGIAGPIIAKSWKENNLAEIQMIYQKSSLNLLIVGLFIFLGIWLSLEPLFSLMPNTEGLMTAKYVVFFLGLAQVVNMGTSVNNEIITYSKHFRFNFYAILLLAVFNVVCNIVFIPHYQMVGAAMATLASISLFNLIKVIFIKWRFDLQPFTNATFRVLIIAGLSFGLTYSLPSPAHPLLQIILNSVVFTALYLGLVFGLRVSPDINKLLEEAIIRLRQLFK